MADAIHTIGEREEQKYAIGDAVEELSNLDSPASVICLDDAWARPQRANQFGVTYDTHPFSDNHLDGTDIEEFETTTTEIIDACEDALMEGGWLIADADDWLLPRLINYLREEWGEVAASYSGGGYRRVGSVTYLTKDGRVDRSTAGMYLTNGGYSVVFAHKGETDRRTSESSRQLVEAPFAKEGYQVAERTRNSYDWGSTKPIAPYQVWVEALTKEEQMESEHLVVPCAGTAPAAIGAELTFGSSLKYTCIDNSSDAYEAFKQRRQTEFEQRNNSPQQGELDSFPGE
jgi:hypothetical protein